ncbi:MAG TPA: SMC family ATPase [Candidatus Blautia faecavium]|uniref:Nuclease SbcCD subunit C n=1 Tax=Candidatus Blautia faecavium TaxID=2838487 RepID=A0A9D2RXN4_9FIRM|nr:SMC family ATPase [Candidatus Blautia faecavium]
MRPIRLTMSAFGSYGGEETIDFSRMEKGIFLVTGDTGAGKTTIFDGIVYALYDRTSGGVRDGNMMRSEYADLRTPTFVELCFSCRGENYRVVRNPDYERESLRKDKNGNPKKTQEKSKAELFLPDGSAFKGNKKQINKKLEEILGMDARQFLQMAMIAQGDFLKLLLARSEERKEIFSKLFDTRIYGKIQEELRRQEKEGYGELKDLENACQEQIGRILCPKEQEEKAELSRMKEQADIKKAIACLEAFIEEDKKHSRELEKKRKDLEEQLRSAGRKKELAHSLLETEKHLASQEKWLQENLPKEAVLGKEEEKARARQKETEEALDTLIRERDNKKRSYEEQQSILEKRSEELKVLKEIWNRADQGEKEKRTLALNWEQANKEYLESRKEYEEMYEAFFREQAGILARELKDGVPCPVCGSTSHPEPALPASFAPSQSQLNTAKKKTVKQEKLREQAGTDYQEAERTVHGILAGLEQEGRRLFGEDFSSADRKWKSHTEDALSQTKEEEESLKRTCQEMNAAFKEKRAALEKENQQAVREQKEAEQVLEDFIRQTERIRGGQQAAKEQKEKLLAEWQALESREASEELLRNIVGELEKEIQALTLQEERTEREYREYFSRLESNKRTRELLETYQEEYEEKKERFVLVRHLSQTACGTLAGSVKLDFESYVQRQYFQRVVQRANVRLMQMSQGQFLLQCRELDKLSMQGKAGLDLDVYSLATESARDVKTLSGGESFMAALAMALGMADVVADSVGAVRLDTLFIDEGFGALDDHAREQAIRVLYELSGEDRLIGIISHVQELKEQIENKLLVKKGKNGSHVRWSY